MPANGERDEVQLKRMNGQARVGADLGPTQGRVEIGGEAAHREVSAWVTVPKQHPAAKQPNRIVPNANAAGTSAPASRASDMRGSSTGRRIKLASAAPTIAPGWR